MFTLDFIDDITDACTATLGDAGTYTRVATGVEYTCNVVLDDVSGNPPMAEVQHAPVPTAQIAASAIPQPEEGDLVAFHGKRYRVDGFGYEDRLWLLTLREMAEYP